MKKRIEEIANEKMAEPEGKLITRKEAIKKTAYIAVSAATMMILLSNPQKVRAAETSPAAPN
ncbi:MAG: hypothetical protein Q8908_12960 [Bacteroidota bacterium]|nr:hypothetical protein [Bacteroidota bacterium]